MIVLVAKYNIRYFYFIFNISVENFVIFVLFLYTFVCFLYNSFFLVSKWLPLLHEPKKEGNLVCLKGRHFTETRKGNNGEIFTIQICVSLKLLLMLLWRSVNPNGHKSYIKFHFYDQFCILPAVK